MANSDTQEQQKQILKLTRAGDTPRASNFTVPNQAFDPAPNFDKSFFTSQSNKKFDLLTMEPRKIDRRLASQNLTLEGPKDQTSHAPKKIQAFGFTNTLISQILDTITPKCFPNAIHELNRKVSLLMQYFTHSIAITNDTDFIERQLTISASSSFIQYRIIGVVLPRQQIRRKVLACFEKMTSHQFSMFNMDHVVDRKFCLAAWGKFSAEKKPIWNSLIYLLINCDGGLEIENYTFTFTHMIQMIYLYELEIALDEENEIQISLLLDKMFQFFKIVLFCSELAYTTVSSKEIPKKLLKLYEYVTFSTLNFLFTKNFESKKAGISRVANHNLLEMLE
jgi:hypothetical protein